MAIDISNLTEKINAFRALTQKDSISPDLLGGLLKQIADLFADVTTDSNVESVLKWQKSLSNLIAICNMAQGKDDSDKVYINLSGINLADGSISSILDDIIINPATDERAGVMCAQQVIDLNKLLTTVNDNVLPAINNLSKQITLLQSGSTGTVGNGNDTSIDDTSNDTSDKTGEGGGALSVSCMYHHIICQVKDHRLYVRGYEPLLNAGYVPYLFRLTKKNSNYHHVKQAITRKGWHLLGSKYSLSIDADTGLIKFNTNGLPQIHMPVDDEDAGYSDNPRCIVHVASNNGKEYVAFGKSIISLRSKSSDNYRMLRLPFAIAFATEVAKHKTVFAENMVSNLAQFSIIFDTHNEDWVLSK
jgi:hypothetical protein